MKIINTAEIADESWNFLGDRWTNSDDSWSVARGTPKNAFEKLVKRPNAARYRASLEACMSARSSLSDSVLISHLPRIGAPTEFFRRHICNDVPHILFAFNYTELPSGILKKFHRSAFKTINKFVVFSSLEKKLYSEYFDIPPTKIDFLHWAMGKPTVADELPFPTKKDYVCSIGGEGRDYTLLARVMRDLPHVQMYIVARPYSVAGIDFPENVTVFENLPSDLTWKLAVNSRGLVIPLKTADTACGHITIVGAQLLGIPLAVTNSLGVSDYVGQDCALLMEAGNYDTVKTGVLELAEQRAADSKLAAIGKNQAEKKNDLNNWLTYFQNTLASISPTA